MGLLDIIKSLLTFNKKQVNIIVQDLSKVTGESAQLEIGLYEDETPLADKTLTININHVDYARATDSNGIARLNINLPVGEYDTHIVFDDPDYHYTKSFCNVTVNPIVRTSDLNMSFKDGSKYTATLEDAKSNRLTGVKVVFNVNGKNYERTTDNNGVASLNINLPAGDYNIHTKVFDVVKKNTIHIAEPAPTPTDNNHYGYWVFGKDMLNTNLSDLRNHGVTDILLNYYALTVHGEAKVLDWIQQANSLGLHVHIWMQCFYNGSWINPKTTDLTDKINEARKYANMQGVYGVHLDYLRYPGNAYKTDGATEAVNNFTQRVREAVGDKFLSCAIMPESENEYYYGQDAGALGKIVDVAIPMQYKCNYQAGSSWLASTTKTFSQMANIWSGLQSYKSDDDTTVLSESELQNDINTCTSNGAKGAMLFRYGLSPNITFPSAPTPTGKKPTKIEGTDINMTYRDGTVYQCAVYDDVGRVAGTVNLTVNGKTYPRTPDITGLYKLNLQLPVGNYTLDAAYLGDDTHLPSSITNNITINEPKPEPQKSRSEKILDEFEKYFGECQYIDDALEKIQGNGYAFYFSDGYNMYETIRRMANYEGANCFDAAEVFYHLAKGMNTKYGRNYEVQYLDVWCKVSGYDHIRLRLRSNGSDWFYRDPACVLNGGDITDNWCGTSDNILEVNPDWIYDGD